MTAFQQPHKTILANTPRGSSDGVTRSVDNPRRMCRTYPYTPVLAPPYAFFALARLHMDAMQGITCVTTYRIDLLSCRSLAKAITRATLLLAARISPDPFGYSRLCPSPQQHTYFVYATQYRQKSMTTARPLTYAELRAAINLCKVACHEHLRVADDTPDTYRSRCP